MFSASLIKEAAGLAACSKRCFLFLRFLRLFAAGSETLGISQAEKPWKVRLLFAREVATYIRERAWHASQQLRQRRNGTLDLRLQTSSRKELIRWILSWMPHVKVLAPRQLRERVRERLRQGLLGCA